MSIGIRVRELRNHFGLKQSEFARVLGIKQSPVSQIESGRILPSMDTLSKIIREFNIKYDWLIDGRGSMLRAVEEKGEMESQKNFPQVLAETQLGQPTGMNIQNQKSSVQADDSLCKEKNLVIDSLMNRLESLKTQLTEQKQILEARLADKDKQIEDLKNNLGMVIASKDAMLAMKDEAIKGKEATLAAKDEIIRIQSKRICELEDNREAEDLKKILGTSERIGQENISLTDIHPKDLSTKAKKGEYKV